MASNPVIMARRTAAGLIAHAANGCKEDYDLTYRMFMEDMEELGETPERAMSLLVMASVGIAAHFASEDPEHLADIANNMAGA